MKYADISGLSEKELVSKTKELREKMFESSMKNSLGQLANPMTIREMRRDVARLQTALTAKANGTAKKPAKPSKKAPSKKTAKG